MADARGVGSAATKEKPDTLGVAETGTGSAVGRQRRPRERRRVDVQGVPVIAALMRLRLGLGTPGSD